MNVSFITRRTFAKSTLILAASALASTPAFAHAVPKSMDPAPDSTVPAPSQISIVFSEELEPKFSVIKLADSTGKIVSTATAVLDKANAKHLTLALPKLSPGVYTVQWTSSATDGHKLSRSYNFTIK